MALSVIMRFPTPAATKRSAPQNASSIREHDVLQPLLVRPRAKRRFKILFEPRRYRGAAKAEKETVPVCIREMTDGQVLEAQLVELSVVVKRYLSAIAGLHVVDISTRCRCSG
jgi:hypothetical protein